MAAQVVLYVTEYCPYCVRAKALLKQKGVAFREINVEDRADLRTWLVDRSGQRTVPQVFVNGEALGGFTDIAALDRAGKLDAKLATDPGANDPPVLL